MPSERAGGSPSAEQGWTSARELLGNARAAAVAMRAALALAAPLAASLARAQNCSAQDAALCVVLPDRPRLRLPSN